MYSNRLASLFKAPVVVTKGAPFGNTNAAGGGGGGKGKAPAGAHRYDSTKPMIDNLEKAIPGMKAGRNSVNGHPVDIQDGNPEEGIDMRGVDGDAAKGALKFLRGKGFPVKRHNDTEFTVGGTFKKVDVGFSALFTTPVPE